MCKAIELHASELASRSSIPILLRVEEKPSIRTVTRTIRITRDIEKALDRISDVEKVSMNHVINGALRRWVEWDYYAERFGVISLPSVVLRRIMVYLTDEEAAELGRWTAKNVAREFVNFWFKEFSERTLLRGIALLSSKYANHYDYEYAYDEEKHEHTLILRHGTGRKWTLYFEQLIKTAFNMLGIEIETDAMENQLVLRLPAGREVSDA